MPPQITIYADGACSGNPGPGGWGAIIIQNAEVTEIGGYVEESTNNKMELTAVGKALRHIEKVPGNVKIFTDSRYVVDGVTKWVKGWKEKGWKKADGKEIANIHYWKRLVDLIEERRAQGTVELEYVAGHSGHPANTRCDEIAVSFSKRKSVKLYHGPLSKYGVRIGPRVGSEI